MQNVYGTYQLQEEHTPLEFNALADMVCHNCSARGHLARNCPKPSKSDKQHEALQATMSKMLDALTTLLKQNASSPATVAAATSVPQTQGRSQKTPIDYLPCLKCPKNQNGEYYRHFKRSCPNQE